MSIAPTRPRVIDNGYPTWSAEPMPETDWHRRLMILLIDALEQFYAGQTVYVTGNILVFYKPGDKRRHISPDVWLARGVEHYDRPNYLVWEEPRPPEFVIELTSSTTAREDRTTKLELYRDVLKVREYYLFDPHGDYLDPPLQGYRLRGNAYQRIRPRDGRLPSQVTGLHLEADGQRLRLWNPETQSWLLTRAEAAEERAETAEERAETAENRAETAEERVEAVEAEIEVAKAEVERLRRENEQLRRRNGTAK
jgi:Uma2 family endonuclease